MGPVDFADDPAGRSVGPRWNAARRRHLTLLLIGSGPAVRPLQVAARLNEQGAVLNPGGMSRLHRTRAANREQPQRV
jgi:hypothetical protein